MANVLIKRRVASQNVDSLNRTVIAEADVENGNVFELLTRSTTDGEDEVWNATAPATAAILLAVCSAPLSLLLATSSK